MDPTSPKVEPTPTARPRYHRSLKNYLIDGPFQLKYTSYLVGIAVVLSISLGGLLFQATNDVIAQSVEMVEQGREIVARGQEVVGESQKVSAVVRMNIVRDPDYKDNPALAAAFDGAAAEQDRRLALQQEGLRKEAALLAQRSAEIASQRQRMLLAVGAALSLLVLGIGIGGVLVTHRIAGPVHKMKRLLLNVGDGHLVLRERLRKGDELQHFFDTFERMVTNLRERQAVEISKLDAALAHLDGKASDDAMQPLRSLRKDMQDALDT